ncbi:MAG: hypothetical protein AAF610_11060 [Pseudomonadota bacterium]
MASDLDRLKDLLFGHEKKALDALTRRLDTAESRTADVADVLPDAIDRSARHGPKLSQSLKKPLEETLTEAITRDPQRFAAALYPVMGPAIRRAIAEALKSLMASLNRAVDTSLSPTARWRARRAGLTVAEFVLRESLIFRVDEVYLIDPRSGLLIEHVRHPDTDDKDEDAISAMLSAIQEFVRDSFSDGDDRLASATIGEFTVWVCQGPFAMLAAVIRGTPPQDLRNQLDMTVERLHLTHNARLEHFDGERCEELAPELASCLRYKLRPATTSGFRLSPPLLLTALLFLAAVSYGIYDRIQRQRTLAAWNAALTDAPGIVVTASRHESRSWRRHAYYQVEGLRDPLAADPVRLAVEAGIPADRAVIHFAPYVSLEPEIVVARAGAVLKSPEGVELSLNATTLVATGEAGVSWQDKAARLGPALPGVTSVDLSGVSSSDAALYAEVVRRTVPPESVRIRVEDGVAILEGRAERDWVSRIETELGQVDGLRGHDLSDMVVVNSVELTRLRSALSDRIVAYSVGTSVARSDQLPELASDMRALLALAAAAGDPAGFTLTGLTDGSGALVANRRLRAQRAEDLIARLQTLGVPATAMRVGTREALGPGMSRRGVRITVRSESAAQ